MDAPKLEFEEPRDRRPWKRRRTCIDLGVRLDGPWEDIGIGKCQRCSVERRLYRPDGELDRD